MLEKKRQNSNKEKAVIVAANLKSDSKYFLDEEIQELILKPRLLKIWDF